MAIDFQQKPNYTAEDLRCIMELLRSEEGCPWDREQTHKSIRKNLIEETYEAVEAIDNEDSPLLKEELGDIMLQVVFHARISEEAGGFNLDDVADGICKKLIIRHPHIFGESIVSDSEGVLEQWEDIKRQEKHQETYSETLRSVPVQLPALMRSVKLVKRAEKAGLRYDSAQTALDDVQRRLDSLREAVTQKDKDLQGLYLGELLLGLSAVSRLTRQDAEENLSFASERFINRFEKLEALVTERGIKMDALSKTELCQLWQVVLAELHD